MPNKIRGKKTGISGYPDLVTPLTAPLRKGDPRFPVANPPVLQPSDPLGYVSRIGNGSSGGDGGIKRKKSV